MFGSHTNKHENSSTMWRLNSTARYYSLLQEPLRCVSSPQNGKGYRSDHNSTRWTHEPSSLLRSLRFDEQCFLQLIDAVSASATSRDKSNLRKCIPSSTNRCVCLVRFTEKSQKNTGKPKEVDNCKQ